MPDPFSPGSIVDNRYEIIAHIGEGGMGGVYKARQLDLDRIVALKVLHAGLLSDPDSRARFEREGRALSELSHDNILMFFQFGFFDSIPYIAMEFLEGQTLRALLDENPEGLPWQRCLPVCISICAAMEYAHGTGVIHRDLKPNNIVIVQDPSPDFVKIVDFGLSRNINAQNATAQHLTQTGALIGSVFYMSPEQCKGQKADQRSDIYAVGCMLYELLFGRAPFIADNPIGLMHKHVVEQVEFPKQAKSSIPADIATVLRKALAKDPDRRYQSMQEFETALRRIESGQSLGTSTKEQPITDRRDFAIPTAIALAVAALAIVWLSPPELIVARINCSSLPVQEADTFRLRTANAWVAQGNLKPAIALLADQRDEYSPLAVSCKVLRAELLQRTGNGREAVQQVREALAQLAMRARHLPANKFLQADANKQLSRCIAILHNNGISFIVAHGYFRQNHQSWYSSPQGQARTHQEGKLEPGIYSSLNALLQYGARRQDRPFQARLYEFELPALERCTDKVYAAAIYRFLSTTYVAEYNPDAAKFREKSRSLFDQVGLKVETLDLLTQQLHPLLTQGKIEEARELLKQCNALVPQVLRQQENGIENDTPVFVRFRIAQMLRMMADCSIKCDEQKQAERYLHQAIDLTAGHGKAAQAAEYFHDLSGLLVAQGRFAEASALLNKGLAQAGNETVIGMGSKSLIAEVHDSILSSMFICWKAQMDLERGHENEAEKGFKLALSGLENCDVLEGSDLQGQKIAQSYNAYKGILECISRDSARRGELTYWCQRAAQAIPAQNGRFEHAEMLATCSQTLRALGNTRESDRYLNELAAFAEQNEDAAPSAFKTYIHAALVDRQALNFKAALAKLQQAAKYAFDPESNHLLSISSGYAYLCAGQPDIAAQCFRKKEATTFGAEQATVGLSICASLSQTTRSSKLLSEEATKPPQRPDDRLAYLFAVAIQKPSAPNEPATQKLLEYCRKVAREQKISAPVAFDLPAIAAQLPNRKVGTEIALAMIAALGVPENKRRPDYASLERKLKKR
ncbi:MAG: serine/threonine protein kinase [Candidatus Obscuribacterales bacterium]|nr:serine/threonine protein kinase [Candidatus Obscuribacterales bacterium]